MYKKSKSFCIFLLFALIAASNPAWAQSEAEEEAIESEVLEEVIVTGTHIAGLSEAQLPVTVLTGETIEKTGAVNMLDVLSYIPSISDFEFEESNNGTNAARGDVAGINMRGMGSGNTLVLLNGRRMVQHPVSQVVDSVPVTTYNVNSIPSAGVKRIEVLRDGAAPLYGADAIAGVVNFVPYTSYDGLRLTGRYGWSENTSYDEVEVTAAGGFDFNDGLTRIGLFGTFYDRNKVRSDELDELYFNLNRRGNESIPEEWRNDSQLDNRSSLTPWARFQTGEFTDEGSWEREGRYIVDPESGEIVSGSNVPRDYYYNFNETAWVTSDLQRYNLMLTLNHEFNNGMEFFGDASYYNSSTTLHRAASPLDSGLAFLIVPPDAYYNPFPGQEVLITGWRPTALGPRIIDVDNDTWRVMGGLRGNWGQWDWESALVFSEAKAKDTESNRQAKSLFLQALAVDGPGALNPFGGPDGNSQETLDLMRIATTDKRSSKLGLWDFRLNRNDLFQTFGNDAGIAMGLEWRQEKYTDDRDSRIDGSMPFNNGAIFDESDVIGMSATFDSKGSRNTYSAYAELYLPLIGAANEMTLAKALEVQLALRYENPDNFGSTTKPKIGIRWAPVDALSLRGSYTEGFRAPNLWQLNQGTIVRRLQNIDDPLREDVTGSALDSGDTYRYTTRLANPDLQPEDATTVLLGFMFAPLDGALSGFQFGVDWWNIKTEDAVGIIDNNEQMDLDVLLRSQGSFNPNVVRDPITAADQLLFDEWNAANPDDQRTPVGAASNIISQYINLDEREIGGYDAMIMYVTPETRAGTFTFRGDLTKITKYEQKGLADPNLRRRNGNPELRYTLSANWEYKAFNAFLSMRYIDDFYDTSLWASGDELSGTYNPDLDRTYWDVDSWTVYNLSFKYDFGYLDTKVGGLVLSAGIRNLTNEDPPFADESFGYRRQVHNSYGRVWWLKADYRF